MSARKRNGLIRVGVLGIGRGGSFAQGAGPHLGLQLVALCDQREKPLKELGKRLNVATYTDFDKFLKHDLDAVILANYFHQHAPFAIKALEAGKHVMSETMACFTLAEGVALIEAVEKSRRVYMFAENYPYMLFNQEMKRIYQSGAIGTFVYGEGEYVHPGAADWANSISPGIDHWRNWLPATYYSSHSLAPLMYITETWPKKVNAFVVPAREDDPVLQLRPRRGDPASAILVRMNDDSICKLLQVYLRGHGIWVRVHGSKGQMENLRHGDTSMVRLRREQYHEKLTTPHEQIYTPSWPAGCEKAAHDGHGGGDFFMNFHFANAIRSGKPPFLDVYRGVAMSTVAIQAYRSALNDSNSFQIPDFRQKHTRDEHRDDDWNPDPTRHRDGMPWPSIHGELKPSAKAITFAMKTWKKMGVKVR
jgi:predicted dehydrogenase